MKTTKKYTAKSKNGQVVNKNSGNMTQIIKHKSSSITIWGIVVGLATIIATVYAIMSYYNI